MKKIIGVGILSLLIFSSSASAMGEDNISNAIQQGTDAVLKQQCTDAGGLATIENTICTCSLFPGTPAAMNVLCANIPSEEELTLKAKNCELGEILKDGTCCPYGKEPYDKSGLFGGGGQYTKCCNGTAYDDGKKCCEIGSVVRGTTASQTCTSCSAFLKELNDLIGTVVLGETITENSMFYKTEKEKYMKACSDNTASCAGKAYSGDGGISKCCDGTVVDGVCLLNTYGKMGIEISPECLINGQCKFNIYKVLNIRQGDQETANVKTLLQDVVLAATTFFGTLLTAIIVISGLFYVLSPLNEALKARAKKGITAGIIGLLFVIGAYSIVRLVQFLATGGGG